MLIRALTLKIYGEELVSPHVGTWISMARLIMWLMALIEGCVWTYAAYQFLPVNSPRFEIAVCVGLIIMSMVLVIDISIITASSKEPAITLSSERGGVRSSVASAKAQGKFWSSVSARILVAAISIYAISPMLNLLVFAKDIDAVILEKLNGSLDVVETKIQTDFKKQQERVQLERNALTDKLSKAREQVAASAELYSKELAGKGRTTKPGAGPVAQSIETQIELAKADEEKYKNELLELAKDPIFEKISKERDDFLKAKKDNAPDLRTRWSIKDDPNSLDSRLSIYREKIESTPSAWTIRWIIGGFQGLLLIAFLLLKMFEPEEVAGYYSYEIQKLKERFDAGLLHNHSRKGFYKNDIKFPMSPNIFYEQMAHIGEIDRIDTEEVGLAEIEKISNRRLNENIASAQAQLQSQRVFIEALNVEKSKIQAQLQSETQEAKTLEAALVAQAGLPMTATLEKKRRELIERQDYIKSNASSLNQAIQRLLIKTHDAELKKQQLEQNLQNLQDKVLAGRA